jgi:hypothetical protein
LVFSRGFVVNRKQREAAKVRQEAIKQSRSAAQAQLVAERARRAADMQTAFARIARRPPLGDRIRAGDVVRAKAPRLLESGWVTAVDRLTALDFVRPIQDWAPRGKGRDTLFRSLAAHLLARFPVPAIVWNAFHDDAARELVPLAVHVAGGGSLYAYVQSSFAIPLTRRMCHDLLATPADFKLLDAIRRAQARAAGVDRRFFEAWRTTRYSQEIGTKDFETFWYSVLEWFAKVPMLEPAEIGPLCDYIANRRFADPLFSMKGRSPVALLRGMKEWHGGLAIEKMISGKVFASSGFRPGEYKEHRREGNGAFVNELWRINEILTARALADEGKRMGHCVYSYAGRIDSRDTSIWSVQMEDGRGETGRWHMVTLEVRNDLRRVVQARGRFNRSMTNQEHRVVAQWARTNNLGVTLGSW